MRSIKKWTSLTLTLISLSLSNQTLAADDFNIPFINAAELGNMYSGWAVSANDASTAFSNPAGLTLLGHQQLSFSALGLSGSTRFTGTQTTPPFFIPGVGGSQTGGASSKLRAMMPNFYYAYPIRDRVVIAFGQNAPFALGTNYRDDSVVRYAATRTKIVVLDVGPSIGVKINDKWSVGLGLDINRIIFKIYHMIGPPVSIPDAESQNNLYGWGYGWHGGVLYRPTPCTRIGLSFNSQIMLHTSGNSEYYSPAPQFVLRNTNQKSNAALPARTQLSISQEIGKRLTLMATVFYTNWSEFQQLTLKRVAIPLGGTTSITIPFQYHNTFDYSIGANIQATDKWLLRTGLNFVNTPSNNHDRSVADPIGSGIMFGLGAHYQQNRCLGYDLSYGHAFFQDTHINVVTPLTTLKGHSSQNGNILGGQVTWNIS
ncbi:MAG: OmpP1/FadL family transporter [Gammaproteobacteria bacterium]